MPATPCNKSTERVASSGQRNTMWSTVELEGDRDGTQGTSRLIRDPASGSVAAIEAGTVVERDRPCARQARVVDSRCRSPLALTLAEREEVSLGSQNGMGPAQTRDGRSGGLSLFVDSQSPWQPATNENTNRLLHPYLPKSTDLARYS